MSGDVQVPMVTPSKLIAVTGATGFVGARIVSALRDAGHEVLPFGSRDWDIAAGPLADAPQVDAVVHAAAKVDVWGDPADFARINVDGTRNVLATWPDAHVVHVSSSSVYPHITGRALVEGDAPTSSLTEVRARELLNDYCRTKAEAEVVVARGARSATILRPHRVYDDANTSALRALRSRTIGRRLLVLGHGDTTRVSVTHVDNLAHAARRGVEAGVEGVFNIADPGAPTIDEFALAQLRRAGHADVRALHVPAGPMRAAARGVEALWRGAHVQSTPPVTRYLVEHDAGGQVLDLTAAHTQLGYSPTRSWRELTDGAR
jgi:nucleoside-diphosphate-sugar epimerase